MYFSRILSGFLEHLFFRNISRCFCFCSFEKSIWKDQKQICGGIHFIQQFLSNIPISYPLKTSENQIFPDIFGGIKWEQGEYMG